MVTHKETQKSIGEEMRNFCEGISPKVNLIPRLDFEHVFYDAAFQHVCHYATETPPVNVIIISFLK